MYLQNVKSRKKPWKKLLASCQPLTKKARLASRIQIRAEPKEIFKDPQKLVAG
jgi:hypothetical protein